MKMELCPKCKQLPMVELEEKFFRTTCVVHCSTFGCPLYYPIVRTSFSKEKALSSAAKEWDKRVKEITEKIN